MTKSLVTLISSVAFIAVGLGIVSFFTLADKVAPGANWLSDFVFFETPTVLVLAGTAGIAVGVGQALFAMFQKLALGRQSSGA